MLSPVSFCNIFAISLQVKKKGNEKSLIGVIGVNSINHLTAQLRYTEFYLEVHQCCTTLIQGMSVTLILLLLPNILGSSIETRALPREGRTQELLASIGLLLNSLNIFKTDPDSFEEEDDTIEPPTDPNLVANYEDVRFNGSMAETFELPLVIMYDSSVGASHGYLPSTIEKWVLRVAELTKPRLAAIRPSSIRLNVTKVEHWPGRFKVTPKVLKNLAKGRPNKKYLTMLLVGGTGGRRKGSAVLGSACYENGFALGMLEDLNNDNQTARILAHEIGHTLGMR